MIKPTPHNFEYMSILYPQKKKSLAQEASCTLLAFSDMFSLTLLSSNVSFLHLQFSDLQRFSVRFKSGLITKQINNIYCLFQPISLVSRQ